MLPKPTVGVLVPLVAKPDKISDATDFLLLGLDIVTKTEPLTLQWFGIKYVSEDPVINSTFAVFDAFASEEGRKAHLGGKVVAAVAGKAEELLTAPPEVGAITILASKVAPIAGASGPTAGLTKGLRVLIKAKEEKADAVRTFLTNAVATIEEEPHTPVWYAIEYPGTNVFGIVDFFADEAGRKAHIEGKVAQALFAKADEVLASPPDVVTVDVIGAKL